MPEHTVARPFFRPGSEALRYLPECPRQMGGTEMLGWVAIQHAADVTEGSFNLLDMNTLENLTFPLPDGVIFGTKHLAFSQPIASLYHYSTDLRELRGGQTCSNGKYFHDGLLIDIDTQPKTISEYRYRPDGPLELLRLITPPEALPALPDGLRATADGKSIVVAYFNPAHVSDGLAQQIRISDGAVLREYVIPGSPRVTCPEFVHIDGKDQVLFTTAVEGMPAETCALAPEAGTMFLADC
jgi:sugar lactone lactonase YvrE